MAVLYNICTSSVWVICISTSVTAYGIAAFCFFNLSHSVRCVATVTVVLVCVSLVANDVEQLFTCLFATCVSCSVICSCLSFSNLIFFFYCWLFKNRLFRIVLGSQQNWVGDKDFSICLKKWLARGQVNVQMRQNFVAQFVQLLKCWLFWTSSWRRIGPILLSSAGCRLQFSVYLVGLLSILLRCNDFSGIQKAMVYQTGSSPLDSGHDLSLVQVWLREVLWGFVSVQPLSSLSLVVV